MEIIFVCVIVISLLLMIITFYHNKFQFSIIKIEEAENNIDVLLEKKCELLNRTRPIIKKELKLDEFLEDIEDLNDRGLNHFEINEILKNNSTDLFKIIDENEKLLKSEILVNIIEELNDNEEQIIGSVKFYNDSVVEFNKLVVSFPANVIAIMWRYKKKEFYSNEKREIYQILNDK